MLVLFGTGMALKLTRSPEMSWWFVTAPLWLPVLLLGISLTFVAAFIGIAALVSKDAK